MHLVYEAGLARPLFATFRDLGAGGEKTSTQQLLQQAARAASNYARPTMDGKAVVHRVLTNAVILNALSPGLREKITGAKYGTDMSQLAGQLINGTIEVTCCKNNAFWKAEPANCKAACLSQICPAAKACLKQTTEKKFSVSAQASALSTHSCLQTSSARQTTPDTLAKKRGPAHQQ